jgi:hypothetical protein
MADVDHDEMRSFSLLHERLRKESSPLLARLLPMTLLRQWMVEQRQGNQYRNDPKRLLRAMLSKQAPPDAWQITKAALELHFHATPEAVPMIVQFCRRVGLECDEQATLAAEAEPWTINDERALEAFNAFRGSYDKETFALYGLYFAGMVGWDRHPKLIEVSLVELREAKAAQAAAAVAEPVSE